MKVIRTQVTEARQWDGVPQIGPGFTWQEIVAWVNANGGEARYEHDYGSLGDGDPGTPELRVRTNSGWASVAPGWWVIKGSETFDAPHHHSGTVRVLDHYPCDPDTYAREGWRPAL